MMSMLLFVSLALHIIAFIAIFQLFKQLKSLQEHNNEEIEKLLGTYLEAIREENRFLEGTLTEQKRVYKDHGQQETSAYPETNAPNEDAYTSLTDQVTDDSETSLKARVLQLHDKGMTAENIARQLNCGKTEAELIIKINKKTHDNP